MAVHLRPAGTGSRCRRTRSPAPAWSGSNGGRRYWRARRPGFRRVGPSEGRCRRTRRHASPTVSRRRHPTKSTAQLKQF
jgi:hypothetical protein